MIPAVPIIASAVLQAIGGLAVPYLKRVLLGENQGLAGQVIDQLASAAGIPVADLPAVAKSDPGIIEQAAMAVEPDAASAWIESQRLTNESVAMDYAKEPWWAWAWRPFWMWLLAALWVHALVLQPYARVLLGQDLQPVDAGLLMTLTGVFVAFYMGGHTAKSLLAGRAK